MPPVSAISGMMGPSRAASCRLMRFAVSVLPVNATPAMRSSATRAAPSLLPPGRKCRMSLGIPASCNNLTASKAIRGVCSAGFATTALPATRAALTCPMKIARGKFQGLMQTKTPLPWRLSALSSPVGPGSFIGLLKFSLACCA